VYPSHSARARIDLGRPVNGRHPLNRGRVAWWLALPGLTGGRQWYDLLGRYPAALSNVPADAWRGTARPGGWGAVGRSANAVDTAGVSVALPSMADVTLAFWLWYSPVAFYRVFAPLWTDIGGTKQFGFQPSADGSGNLTARIYVGYFLYSGAAIPAGTWTHVAIVRSGSTAFIYQNGIQTLSQAGVDTTAVSGTLGVVLGEGTSNPQTVQQLDDVAVYSRALSAADVFGLYDLSRRGYPGVLNRVRRRRPFSSPAGTDFTQSLSGSLAASGSLTRASGKPVAGTLAAAGTLARAAARAFAGSAAPTASLARQAGKPLAGAVSAAGAVARDCGKPLSGSAAPSGSLAKAAARPLAGSVSAAGALARAAGKALAGAVAASGSLAKAAAKALTGAISAAASWSYNVTSGGVAAAAYYFRRYVLSRRG
jgi:hypothetical protein